MSTPNTTAPKPRNLRLWLISIAVVCVFAWAAFLTYINWAMRQPPEVFGHVMAHVPMPAYFVLPFETLWTSARKGHLNVGDTAPDLAVKRLDNKTPVALGSLWSERPVALVFGSYT